MMKKLISLTLFLFAFNVAYNCSCFYISDYFCPTMNWAAPYLEQNPLFIVKAKVLGINGYLMDVKITENIFDEVSNEEVTIIGQDGLNCNQGLGPFAEGQEVILALYEAYEQGMYNLNGCGRFYLHVDGDDVVGPISNETNSQPYTEFRSGITECFQITSTEYPEEALDISVFPNPCTDQLQVKLAGSSINSQVVLMNTNGQVLERILSNDPIAELNMGPYPAGLYFVQVVQGNRVFSQKVVKV